MLMELLAFMYWSLNPAYKGVGIVMLDEDEKPEDVYEYPSDKLKKYY